MAFGLGVLRLSPAHFWSMTPRELTAALTGHHGRSPTPTPLTHHELATLSTRFPDLPRASRVRPS